MHWSQEFSAGRVLAAIRGYFKALTLKNFRCSFIEEEHLDELKNIKVLFIPRGNVMDDNTAQKLVEFVKNGGTLFCEPETGAWDMSGIYKYPQDRFFAKATGISEIGRREINSKNIKISFSEQKFKLHPEQWFCPLAQSSTSPKVNVMAKYDKNSALMLQYPYGNGKFIFSGAYLGNSYDQKRYYDFENFLETLLLSNGVKNKVYVNEKPSKDFTDFTHVVFGTSAGKKIIFVFIPETRKKAEILFEKNFLKSNCLKDLLSGDEFKLKASKNGLLSATLTKGFLGIHILIEN